MSTLHGLWVALILTMSHRLTSSCPLELNPYNEPPKKLAAARMDPLLILKISHGLNILLFPRYGVLRIMQDLLVSTVVY